VLVVHPVEASPSVCAAPDEADVAQHTQMLRRLRLCEAQNVGELPDRPLPRHERVQDLAAVGLGDRVEDVGCGRGARHSTVYSDMGICQHPRPTDDIRPSVRS
jgi:hypothetical protein